MHQTPCSITRASARVIVFALLTLAVPLMLVACGGGGGGSAAATPPPPPPPPPSPPPSTPPPVNAGPTWSQGVFPPASTLANRCENPRSGVDIEGNRFPDMQGTALEERFWLRSWTNATYLWNTEVTDRNPASYPSTLQYFDLLRTFALTPSGKDKDQFHFSEPTAEYLQRRRSVPTASYGFELATLRSAPPRDIRIRYTEPGSPAASLVGGQPNLSRGIRILTINGMDLVNTNSVAQLDAMANALFPAAPGTAINLTVQLPDDSLRAVSMTSTNLAPRAVNRSSVIDTTSGKVGYILLNTFGTFDSEAQLHNTFLGMQAAGVGDLVLDLRYNGGGLLAVASQLGYMIAGEAATAGRAFERLRFHAGAGAFNPVSGNRNDPVPFYATTLGFSLPADTPLPSLNLPRVFVLSTGNTCSASEAVINSLRGIGLEVILIGDTTCGKPFGFYPQDNCGETYYTIQFQVTNDQYFGDYADGFIPGNSPASFGVRLPGCQVADDFSNELGAAGESLLSAALDYRLTAACPPLAIAGLIRPTGMARAAQTGARFEIPRTPVMEAGRDMTMPPATR